MSRADEAPRDGDEPGLYEIRVRGHLDSRWAAWFEGLTITCAANGETLLRGPVSDQAALHGLLRRVRDLGLPLLAVHAADRGRGHRPDGEEEDTDHTQKEPTQ